LHNFVGGIDEMNIVFVCGVEMNGVRSDGAKFVLQVIELVYFVLASLVVQGSLLKVDASVRGALQQLMLTQFKFDVLWQVVEKLHIETQRLVDLMIRYE